jgi:hypothetical protein
MFCLYQVENDWFGVLAEEDSCQFRSSHTHTVVIVLPEQFRVCTARLCFLPDSDLPHSQLYVGTNVYSVQVTTHHGVQTSSTSAKAETHWRRRRETERVLDDA